MTVDWSPICVASTALGPSAESIPDISSPNRGDIESPSSQEGSLSSYSHGESASPSSSHDDIASSTGANLTTHPQEDLSAHHFKGVEW